MTSYCLLEDNLAQLCCAIQTRDVTVVQMLLQTGVDVNSADKNDETALHVATYIQHCDIVKALLHAGADTDVQNMNGQTPLHIAASRGFEYIVQALLDDGADTDIKTQFTEMTALHMASQNGHTQVVRALLEHGANIDQHDLINKPAQFYAANEEISHIFDDFKESLELDDTPESKILQNKVTTKDTLESDDLQNQSKISPPEQPKGQKLSPAVERKPINHKIKYSKQHKKIMKMNVFDRLTKRKSQLLK